MWRTAGLVLLCLATQTHGEGVYQWRAKDGSLVFSDRPPPDTGRAVGIADLPRANVIEPFDPLPAAPRPRRSSVSRATSSPVAATDCAEQREVLARLWLKRRRGYAAGEGAALRQRIRQLQSQLRADCGSWR